MTSTPSNRISPSVGISRSKLSVKDDFPEPVLPTTPIFSPDRTVKERLWRTLGPSGVYLAERPLTIRSPVVGQAAGGLRSGEGGSSCSISRYA